MVSLTQPARALVDPADGVPAAVTSHRWVWPLLALILAVSFSGAAFATRWNVGSAVVRELSQGGEINRVTEKELEDKIATTGRVKLVGGVAKGIFLMPLVALLFAVGLKISGWLINRPITFIKSFTTVTVGLLPIAVFHLIFGLVALATPQLSESQERSLVPAHLGQLFPKVAEPLSRLLGVVDLFNLWSVVMMGLGFSAATGMSRPRSLLFLLLLYMAWAGVFLVGLPGMASGGGGGGR